MNLNGISNKWIYVEGTEDFPFGVDRLPIFQFYKACLAGAPLENTRYVVELKEALHSGNPLFECDTQEAIDRRVDKLQESMSHPSDVSQFRFPVRLHSDGRFYLRDGHHRLARAVLENPDVNVDVEIVKISPEWDSLTEKLRGIYPHARGDFLYQPIEHPFFKTWSTDRTGFRQTLILKYLKDKGISEGAALVIGSCSGYTARNLSASGLDVLGLDINPTLISVAQTLSDFPDFHDATFELSRGHTCPENETVQRLDSRRWKVVTCLSVLHRFFSDNPCESHLSAHREASIQVIQAAHRNAEFFFYESGSPSDPTLLPSSVPLDKAGQKLWLSEICGGAEVHWLGRGYDGRNLFVLVNQTLSAD